MIDWTKPTQTKLGEPLTALCTDADGPYPVVCLCGDNKELMIFTPEGRLYLDFDNPRDAENCPQKHVLYLNIYSGDRLGTIAHPTREVANEYTGKDRIACVRVEFEEGQFDQ